jgi:hypothetical protein
LNEKKVKEYIDASMQQVLYTFKDYIDERFAEESRANLITLEKIQQEITNLKEYDINLKNVRDFNKDFEEMHKELDGLKNDLKCSLKMVIDTTTAATKEIEDKLNQCKGLVTESEW